MIVSRSIFQRKLPLATWVIAAKFVSVIFVLLQLRILGSVLSTNQANSAFKQVALVALVSQLACAVPMIVFSQSSTLPRKTRRKRYKYASMLFLAVALSAAVVIWLLGPALSLDLSGLRMLGLLSIAIFSSSPLIIATGFFGAGSLRTGALIGVANVVIPQTLGLAATHFEPTAFGWLVGLGTGHFVAFTIAAATLVRDELFRPDMDDVDRRPELLLSWNLIAVTTAALIFNWITTNGVRIFIPPVIDGIDTIVILLVAALSYSASNAVETLLGQVRRHVWLRALESSAMRGERSNFFRREVIVIVTIYFACGVGIIPALYYGYPLVTGRHLNITVYSVSIVVAVDLLRAVASTSYSIAEAARIQKSQAGLMLIATAIYLSILSHFTLLGLWLSYSLMIAVLAIGALLSIWFLICRLGSRPLDLNLPTGL